MDSLISRQAAIEALKEHRALYCDNTPGTFSKLSYPEKCRVDELNTAIATLVNLPSAQPKIIQCKDCKYRTSYWGNCKFLEEKYHQTVLVDKNDFCSRAERKIND